MNYQKNQLVLAHTECSGEFYSLVHVDLGGIAHIHCEHGVHELTDCISVAPAQPKPNMTILSIYGTLSVFLSDNGNLVTEEGSFESVDDCCIYKPAEETESFEIAFIPNVGEAVVFGADVKGKHVSIRDVLVLTIAQYAEKIPVLQDLAAVGFRAGSVGFQLTKKQMVMILTLGDD